MLLYKMNIQKLSILQLYEAMHEYTIAFAKTFDSEQRIIYREILTTLKQELLRREISKTDK